MLEEFTEKLDVLLQGDIPEEIDIGKITDESEQKLGNMLNQLIRFMQEVHVFIIPLSNGELTDLKISRKNFFGSPFKELHSRLLHLTWQANQVAKGDFNQQVDFMGDFSNAFNHMIASLRENQAALQAKIDELEKALAHIKKLEGILPICSYCKKIQLEEYNPNKKEGWVTMEYYVTEKTDIMFSHSICPDCMKKHFPDY